MSGWIKSLGKDTLVYGIGYGATRFLQIIILPIITHALTLSEFGYYSNYVIFYSFAGGLLICGLDSAVARFFFDSDDKKYHQRLFSSAFFFILAVSALSSIAFFIFSPSLLKVLAIPPAYTSSLKYVILCTPVVAMNGFLLSWSKWKREKMKFLFNSGSTIVFLLIPLLVAAHVTFDFIFQVIFWSQLVIFVLSSLLARDYIRFDFSQSALRSLLAYGFPWMLVFLFGASRTYLDRAFLTQYLSSDLYGVYNFSVRVASLLSLVITAFDMSFGPLAFSIWNKETAPAFFARLQSLYTFLICAFACSICVFSPLIIQILGGEKYAGSENILPILLFAAIPLSLINFSNLGINHAKKSILSTVTLFIGLVVVLILNFLLTRHFLQYGATTASLAGHLMIIITGYYFSSKYYRIPFAYAKDSMIFFLFFILSLLSVNFSFSPSMYYEMLIESVILAIVIILLVIFVYNNEYKRGLSAIGVR